MDATGRKRVVIDCDGVLANFVGAWCKLAQRLAYSYEYETRPEAYYLEHDDVRDYIIDGWLGWDHRQEFIARVWDEIISGRAPNFFADMEVARFVTGETSVECCTKLPYFKEHYEPLILTSRPQCAKASTTDTTFCWIRQKFGVELPVLRVAYWRQKIDVIEALEPEIVIDDHPIVLRQVAEKLPSCAVFAPHYPYTRLLAGDSITLVRSFVEFGKLLEGGHER